MIYRNRIKIILPIIGVILLLCTSSVLAAKYLVVRIIDGDTIKVLKMGNKISVRLVGIDAPETSKRITKNKGIKGQPFSKESKNYLSSLVFDKYVDIKSYGQDQYGQTLGVISYGMTNVNLKMIKAGLAEVFRGKMPTGFDPEPYWKAEQEARRKKVGVWIQGDKYISPRDWRRQ